MRWLLIIGDARAAEARELLGGILADCPGWGVVRCRSIDEALASAVADVDVLLVLQTRPGEFSSAGVERIYNAFPLARWMVGFGAWCGSAGRRERVWPESIAVPMWDVVARLRREIREIDRDAAGLPVTAGREERALKDEASAELPRGMRIHIESPDRPLREWLADLISDAGGVPCSSESVRNVDGLIWDIDPWDGLARWKGCVNGPVVSLAGLPTVSVSRELLRAGASVVLGKPCDGDDILRALSRVHGPT